MSCWSMRCLRSSFSVRLVEAVSMISPLRTRRRIPYRQGAGCCRT
jgi:hypothetical protein